MPATRRERQRSADQELPGGLISSLLRALVIALLLPARVLGLGLGRTIQIVFSWPFAILSFIGKVSVFFLGGIAIALIIGILIFLLSNA